MAMNTAPLFSFGFENGPGDTNYLDDVSVVDNSAPSFELLSNPGFENITSNLTGWLTWCQSSCSGNGTEGQLTNNISYTGIYCYQSHCQTGTDFLGQYFLAIVSHNYTLSFWLYQVIGPAAKFYAFIN
jgi:hypothetical protein